MKNVYRPRNRSEIIKSLREGDGRPCILANAAKAMEMDGMIIRDQRARLEGLRKANKDLRLLLDRREENGEWPQEKGGEERRC